MHDLLDGGLGEVNDDKHWVCQVVEKAHLENNTKAVPQCSAEIDSVHGCAGIGHLSVFCHTLSMANYKHTFILFLLYSLLRQSGIIIYLGKRLKMQWLQ